ncbi:MAG: PaaI family thioesterase, partial [Mycobacteriaceae bacterium]
MTGLINPDRPMLTSPPEDTPVDHATEAARRVVNALLRTDRNNASLERVSEELNDIAEHLESHAPAVGERMIDMWSGEGT